MKRLIFPLILGAGGIAILLWLGFWQLARMEWKESVLAEIDARISAAPVPIPENPDPVADKYLPVTVTGTLLFDRLFVLTSVKDEGPGDRVIERFQTEDGRQIMIDRGFVRDFEIEPILTHSGTIIGNLHWPDETDGWTPEPEGELWFARDVAAMAEVLGTEPVLVIARETSYEDTAIRPLPIDTSGIPNDHLNYAITWFLLAVVWAAMTGLLIWRAMTAKKDS